MGTINKRIDIEDFIQNLPQDTLLILDEAYIELAPQNCNPKVDISNANILHFRSFSKAYGLAGLRIGYMLGNAQILANFNKIRNHFGVNRIAQAAALAALNDQSYLQKIIAQNAVGRTRLEKIAKDNGLIPLPSATNFVTMDCMAQSRSQTLLNLLIENGIFIRKPMTPPQDRCIRVSVGTSQEIDYFEQTLPQLLNRL